MQSSRGTRSGMHAKWSSEKPAQLSLDVQSTFHFPPLPKIGTASAYTKKAKQPAAAKTKALAEDSTGTLEGGPKRSAVDEFFRSPELVALMLGYHSGYAKSFLVWQRVNKFFRAVINTNPGLQRRIGVRPILDSEVPHEEYDKTKLMKAHVNLLISVVEDEFDYLYVVDCFVSCRDGQDRCTLWLARGMDEEDKTSYVWTGPTREHGPFYDPNVRQTWEAIRLAPFQFKVSMLVCCLDMREFEFQKDATLGEVVGTLKKWYTDKRWHPFGPIKHATWE